MEETAVYAVQAETLEEMIERGRKTLADVRAAEEAKKDAERREALERVRQSWDAFENGAREALPEILHPYIEFQRGDTLLTDWECSLTLKIPDLAPIYVTLRHYNNGWTIDNDPPYKIPGVSDYGYYEEDDVITVDWEWSKAKHTKDLSVALAVASESSDAYRKAVARQMEQRAEALEKQAQRLAEFDTYKAEHQTASEKGEQKEGTIFIFGDASIATPPTPEQRLADALKDLIVQIVAEESEKYQD